MFLTMEHGQEIRVCISNLNLCVPMFKLRIKSEQSIEIIKYLKDNF